MVQVPLTCPHCHTERVAFNGIHFASCEGRDGVYIALLQCNICHRGVVAEFLGGQTPHWVRSNGSIPPPQLLQYWPDSAAAPIPEHLDDNIEANFFQGIDNLRRGNWDAAGSMFRKTLDASLRRLHPQGKGTLKQRIDGLPTDVGVTRAMLEWAHLIRTLGNDAAHGDFTEEEARALHAFTEVFLTYAFTLPGMLAARKAADPPPA